MLREMRCGVRTDCAFCRYVLFLYALVWKTMSARGENSERSKNSLRALGIYLIQACRQILG